LCVCVVISDQWAYFVRVLLAEVVSLCWNLRAAIMLRAGLAGWACVFMLWSQTNENASCGSCWLTLCVCVYVLQFQTSDHALWGSYWLRLWALCFNLRAATMLCVGLAGWEFVTSDQWPCFMHTANMLLQVLLMCICACMFVCGCNSDLWPLFIRGCGP